MNMTNPRQTHTFMEVHVLLQGVFGGEGFGTDGTHKWLFSSVDALVGQQCVLLGEGLRTNLAAKRLLSWGKGVLLKANTIPKATEFTLKTNPLEQFPCAACYHGDVLK